MDQKYNIVRANQQTLDDLETYLDVFKSSAEDLKPPGQTDLQLKSVQLRQKLSQYIYLEDSLLDGIQRLAETEQRQVLLDLIDTFNVYCADFQDTWDSEMWVVYDELRSYGLNNKECVGPAKSLEEMDQQLKDLQEMAIDCIRMSTARYTLDDNDAFEKIDDEAKYFQNPKPRVERNCDCCIIT